MRKQLHLRHQVHQKLILTIPYQRTASNTSSDTRWRVILGLKSKLTNRALFDTTFLRQSNRNVKHCTANIYLFCPRNVMIGWEELPNKNFPIIFHPVFGKDEREGSSPSFFNVAEVETIERYLRKLLDDNVRSRGLKHLRPEMIGVISPYKRQVSTSVELIFHCSWRQTIQYVHSMMFFFYMIKSFQTASQFIISPKELDVYSFALPIIQLLSPGLLARAHSSNYKVKNLACIKSCSIFQPSELIS